MPEPLPDVQPTPIQPEIPVAAPRRRIDVQIGALELHFERDEPPKPASPAPAAPRPTLDEYAARRRYREDES